ncbi:MAG: 5'-methylthioadenosine/S-adenosylhomocysteine nucleosidase [Hyphomonadaceae bacterium]
MARWFAGLAFWCALVCGARADVLDATPRTAVISAFPPELAALSAAATDKRDYTVGGVVFTTATLEGRPVLLFLSGVSMVNAAMTTQMALDRFKLTRLVFSGIAGGADPALEIGDVVVADRWAQNMESVFARETPQGFAAPPDFLDALGPHFGMIYPRGVRLPGDAAPRVWFPADSALVAKAARAAKRVKLRRCLERACLDKAPKVVIGGAGVSSPAFVDNAAYREFLHREFGVRLIDMESAAVAHVAAANGVAFVALRSLSDLAGGDAGENQMHVFMGLAARNSAAVVRAFLQELE